VPALRPCPRSIQVGEFEVAISGGIWVAIRVYPRDWQGITLEQFIQSVDVYIRWYNEKRIKVSLGSLSPIQYRKSLGFTA